MSKKAVVLAALYTGFLPSLFITIYNAIAGAGVFPFELTVPWMMFPFMAMFFLTQQAPAKVWWFFLTVIMGIGWGAICILLLMGCGMMGMPESLAGFVGIGLGMFITLCVHMGPLAATPLNSIPAIFLGVSLGFSQFFLGKMPATYAPGMIFTFFMAAILTILCMIGQGAIVRKFPAEPKQ